jgi:hypothetical protein
MLGYAHSKGEYVKVYRLLPNGESVWDEKFDENDPDYGTTKESSTTQTKRDKINYVFAKDVDWDNIPPRPWIAGRRLLRGFVSVMTGPGGVGKTALTVTTALSYSLNRNLLDPTNTNPNWKLHLEKPLRTYIYGLEDDIDELKRRVKSVMNFHGVDPMEVGDTLLLGDGSVDRLILAISNSKGLVRTDLVDKLIEVLIGLAVDVLILDPCVKLHVCNENDNGEMDFLMAILKEIAIRANCAIWLIHHSGKTGTATDPHGGRGASSIVAAGRVSETLSTPSKGDYERYGFGRDMVKLEPTKANMSPIGEDSAQWLRISGYPVGNGDYAQVIELVEAKAATEQMDEFLFVQIVMAIREVPKGKVWVSKRGAPTWVGLAFQKGGIGTEDRADALVKDWSERGLLIPDSDATDDRNREIKTALKLNEIMVAKHKKEYFGG